MNEWQTIAWFAGIGGAFLGATWKMVEVAKKDLSDKITTHSTAANGRIKNIEHVIDNMVADCTKKKDDFITTKAFDRFEGHLVTRVENVQKSVEHLTTRFDDFIITQRKGG